MSEHSLAEKWKVVEVQLLQAAEFLLEPDKLQLEKKEFEQYQHYMRIHELKLAMNVLEEIAYKHGTKPGFWRCLQKAAAMMELEYKVKEYENTFHDVLSKNV